MRKLHCCFFLKTRPRGEALRDDTRNHKHTHLVLLPMKTQRVMLTKQPRPSLFQAFRQWRAMRSKGRDERQRGAGERDAPSLLFFRAPFTSHRSPLSERLEQANRDLKTPSTGAVTQRKHQLYKRTKSNPAHRPSISLGRMRASFPLVSTIEQCKHCAVRARKLSPSFCVTLAADFFRSGCKNCFSFISALFLKNQHFCDS